MMTRLVLSAFAVALVAADPSEAERQQELARDPVFLESAGAAGSEDELQQWRAKQVSLVQASVPAAHRQFAVDAVEREYAQRLEQVRGAQASDAQTMPAILFLTSAKRCQSAEELRDWREKQLAQVREVVPAEDQHTAVEAINAEYEKHAARFPELARNGAPGDASEALPVIHINAEEFKTQEELTAWRAEQAEQISRVIPADFRQIALASVDREFESRVAGLQSANPSASLVEEPRLPKDADAVAPFLAVLMVAVGAGAALRVWRSKKAENDGSVYLLADEQVAA